MLLNVVTKKLEEELIDGVVCDGGSCFGRVQLCA